VVYIAFVTSQPILRYVVFPYIFLLIRIKHYMTSRYSFFSFLNFIAESFLYMKLNNSPLNNLRLISSHWTILILKSLQGLLKEVLNPHF